MNDYKWSFIEKFGQIFVQFIISVVFSRILGPEAFGTIAILNVILILSNIVVDSGFSQGLIRKTDCITEDFNSVFWFNLFIASILYIILYFSAPLLLILFNNEELVPLSRVLFLVIPIGALNIIQLTILVKDLKFKQIAIFL